MTKLSALIIEDDPKLGVIFKMALEEAGFEAEVDQSGKHFSARLKNPVPTLVILDIHLPYASGIDIFKRIKADESWMKAFVIVTTADLFLAKTFENRADYVLIKPVSVAKIMRIVNSRWPRQISSDLPSEINNQYE
jgi:DNA-binding response OmpR family regulator